MTPLDKRVADLEKKKADEAEPPWKLIITERGIIGDRYIISSVYPGGLGHEIFDPETQTWQATEPEEKGHDTKAGNEITET